MNTRSIFLVQCVEDTYIHDQARLEEGRGQYASDLRWIPNLMKIRTTCSSRAVYLERSKMFLLGAQAFSFSSVYFKVMVLAGPLFHLMKKNMKTLMKNAKNNTKSCVQMTDIDKHALNLPYLNF